jgi:hypothetical protein
MIVGLLFPEVHVDQTKTCGISNQFNGAVKTKLFENVAAVVLNCFGADEKRFSD